MDALYSVWTRAFDRASGDSRRLVVRSECDVPVPPEIVGWWQGVAEDRGVSGAIRVLEFDPRRPFEEDVRGGTAVVYASGDKRAVPDVLLRSSGAHAIRHLEQGQRPWLVDQFVRDSVAQGMLRADGLEVPDAGFLRRHRDEMPEEVDAFLFEKEVAGFDARPFMAAVRKAVRGADAWPSPERYVVSATRPIGRSKTSFDGGARQGAAEKQAEDACSGAPDGKHAFLFGSHQCLRCRKVVERR